MDQSYSENDVSMSPSQILERLQVLRKLQLMQRGKLQKQRLEYQETTESSSCITEMISHFTNSATSTSYNTFRSLLQSSQNISADRSPTLNASDISQKVQEKDLIDGVSILNLSQESEFIINTPISNRSRASADLKSQVLESCNGSTTSNQLINSKKKHISLDEMPILSPKKDFEALVIEKLENDKVNRTNNPKKNNISNQKRPFLKRGDGMVRFGVKKNDLVIMSTKALPWKKNNAVKKVKVKPDDGTLKPNSIVENSEHLDVNIIIPPLKLNTNRRNILKVIENNIDNEMESNLPSCTSNNKQSQDYNSTCSIHTEFKVPDKIIQQPNGKHPLQANRGKTWASILTTEQSDFLMQLKQSEYYKNFASPTKSTVSDMSYDENTCQINQEKEIAEQNLFELLENKVTNESFNMNTSFFNRFLRRSHLECSGESTPIVMQKCLAENPNLMHIFPDKDNHLKKSYNDGDTCQSEYTECCSDTCSTVSSCCSCKTVEPATPQPCKKTFNNKVPKRNVRKEVRIETNQTNKGCQDEVNKEHEVVKANMAEMNAKLITTSELLKERLRELEDEIETFRKENLNLNKMKEDVDIERQKFYEEKSNFEQKFNEEKILSEYYLAEEKDKLNKQKQMYERYVRDMRGRLNKKEKDEVANLKQEMSNLKEEIRVKDAKSTSTIARLRNQIKIMDKEKTELQNEVEKLKKENRRIQHSNEITRRLTNMKYLEQINKKLSNMNKEIQPGLETCSDVKYKAYEIERQSRSKKVRQANKGTIRPRAKSVPNLKVQSRYAKYFSQRDAVSDRIMVNVERHDVPTYTSDVDDEIKIDPESERSDESNIEYAENYSDNNLEKIYIETFRSASPKSNKFTKNPNNYLSGQSTNSFFLQKSDSTSSTRDSKSPVNISTSPYSRNSLTRSKSPETILSHRSSQRSPVSSKVSANHSTESHNTYRSKSPVSVINQSSQRSATVIHRDLCEDNLMNISPEPSTSITSLIKTNLNPTEYRKPDGSRELRFPNGNIKYISADGTYCKFVYYNGDIKENFYNESRIKYYYADNKTYHTTHPDGHEVLEFPDGQVEKRYKDGSSEVRLPNGSVRYHDPKNEHVREEWRFPDGSALTVSANGERRILFPSGQIEVHASDHKRREFPDGTVKLVYNDGTSETRYASGRVRIKDKHGNLIMDSATR